MSNGSTRLTEQRVFQERLDDLFPIGGLCAMFFEQEGRLRPTGTELVTGRVVCTAVKRAQNGGWRYRVMMDPRHDVTEEVKPLVAWIGDLNRNAGAPDLYEARVLSAGEPKWLRINAAPGQPWRPTKAMRRAVTEAHQAGIASPVA